MQARVRVVALALVLAITIAVALGGCVQSGASASDPQLEGTWHLASGSVNGKGLALGGRSVTLAIGDADHTGGTTPCGGYTATVTGKVGVVYIRAAFTSRTRDTCTTAALTTLEQLYISALTSTRFASINQGALVLTSPETDLVFVRSAPTAVANVLLTRWQLYAIPAQVPAVIEGPHIHPIYLSFDGADGLTVASHCSSVSATYRISGENLLVSHAVTEQANGAACSNEDRNLSNQAMSLFDGPLLIDASKASVTGDATLVITNLDDDLPVVWRQTT